MLFKRFASKNQLPGLSVSETLVKNRLITAKYSLFYKQSVVRLEIGTTIIWTENLKLFAAWKVPIFGAFGLNMKRCSDQKNSELGHFSRSVELHRDAFRNQVMDYFCKSSILDVWLDFEYHSAKRFISINSIKTINNKYMDQTVHYPINIL